MVEISTSILSVKKENVIKTIYNLETAHTDYFHIDVMDGKFVEDDTTEKMLEYCDYLSNITNLPLDVHLMVSDVHKYIDMFLPYNPNIITVHYESFSNKDDLVDALDYIKSNGCKAGISIKPGTRVDEILELLHMVHVVLIMTVEPGKGGQQLINDTIKKVRDVSDYIKNNELDVAVEADGGITVDNVEELKEAGTEIIVSGTEIINSNDYVEIINKLKE